MRKNIVVTGEPHSGKSSLVKSALAYYGPKMGFLTSEIRVGRQRMGFEIETSNGKYATLASVDGVEGPQVSRYHVDIAALESMVGQVKSFGPGDLLYLDEIGQMELYSPQFMALCLSYLAAPNTCIATLASVYEHPFIDEVKRRADIILVEISESNRNERARFVRELIGKVEKARQYAEEPARFSFAQGAMQMRSTHGRRELHYEGDSLLCSCDFSEKYRICSHALAAEELLSRNREHKIEHA